MNKFFMMSCFCLQGLFANEDTMREYAGADQKAGASGVEVKRLEVKRTPSVPQGYISDSDVYAAMVSAETPQIKHRTLSKGEALSLLLDGQYIPDENVVGRN